MRTTNEAKISPLPRRRTLHPAAAARAIARRRALPSPRDAAAGRRRRHPPRLGRSSVAYGIACRLFAGFTRLPPALLEAIRPWGRLFEPETGPLSLADRGAIARGVSNESDWALPQERFGRRRPEAGGEQAIGAAGPGRSEAEPTVARSRALEAFARKLVASRHRMEGSDVERLLAVGLTPAEIRDAARVVPVYKLIDYLTAAPCLSALRRPRLATAAATRRGNGSQRTKTG